MSHQQVTKVKFFTPWLVVNLGDAKEAPPPFSPSFRCSFQQKLCEILGYRLSLGNPWSATLNIVICRSMANAKAPVRKMKDEIFGICNPSFWSGFSSPFSHKTALPSFCFSNGQFLRLNGFCPTAPVYSSVYLIPAWRRGIYSDYVYFKLQSALNSNVINQRQFVVG